MARQTQTFEIDGETYVVKQLTTTVGIPLGHRVVKAFGPAVREFLKSLPKGGMSEFARSLMKGNVDEEQLLELGSLVVSAIESCPTQLLTELGDTFSQHTTIRAAGLDLPLSTNGIYDEHFAGRPGQWLKWITACIRFNWAGFFSSSTRSSQATTGAATTTPSA